VADTMPTWPALVVSARPLAEPAFVRDVSIPAVTDAEARAAEIRAGAQVARIRAFGRVGAGAAIVGHVAWIAHGVTAASVD
jgi:hypothetical protein